MQNNEYNSFYNVSFKVLSGEMNVLLVYNDVCVFYVCVMCIVSSILYSIKNISIFNSKLVFGSKLDSVGSFENQK